MGYVIGCDVGSQSLKGLLLAPNGNVVATASASYPLRFPHLGWAEQDPRDWMNALKAVVTQLIASFNVSAEDVKTLGLASQVDGLVAVDQAGQVLRPAIIWMDRRAEAQCAGLASRLSKEKIFQITGLNLDSSHVAPKVIWLRDNEPKNFRAMKRALLPGAYLVQQLTGEEVVDHSNLSSTMLYDVNKRTWSEPLLAATELDKGLFGELRSSMDIAGTLRKEVAQTLGLHPTTKVVVGCGDEHAACLGAGLISPGLICDITGTAEPVCTATAEPLRDRDGLVETHAHADPRWWLMENPGFVSGGSLRWLSDLFGISDYEELCGDAGLVPDGSEGLIFLPCLSGAMTPTWNGKARGVYFGMAMKHNRGHMTRAVMEGCAYGLRDIVDRFHSLGLGGDEICVTGGGARSDVWCQIKADVTGCVIKTLREPESTAMGAAMLAAVAEGIYSSLDEAASQVVSFSNHFEPDPKTQAVYAESYSIYREVYAALDPIFTKRRLDECNQQTIYRRQTRRI